MIKVPFFINTDNIKQCQETYMLFEHVDVTACQRHHDSCIIYSTVSSIVCNLYNALMYLKKMRITQKMSSRHKCTVWPGFSMLVHMKHAD